MKKLFTLFALVLSMSLTNFAQTSGQPITEIDYFNATRYSGARNIARTTDGYVIVVFEPGSGWTNQDIWYANYNPAFMSWDVAQLSQSTTNATGIPAVVADEAGHVFAAWKEKADDGTRNAMFSKCTFQDAFTHSWTTPVIADTINNNTGVLTIDTDIDDNPFIMFSIWNDPAIFNANIYVSKSYDDGVTWTTDNLTSQFPTPDVLPFNYMDVNLTAGPDGKMYAVWEDKPTEITKQYEILFSEYTPSQGWSYPEIISPIFDGGDQVQKYVDAMTPVDGAVSVYQMGPAGYTFEGETSALYYDNGTSQVFSAAFNPFYTVPSSDNTEWIGDIISSMGITTGSSILFVDDDNRYNNESSVTDVLDELGYSYTNFDCGNNGGMATDIPSATDYDGKDLVIWFTGDDYKNLAFWNIADEDNPELINYLNTTGKKLIVIGKDFLYDRYGTAPDTFAVGDFVYDKLGISSYDGQSWRDDGNTGVTELNLVQGCTMTTLSRLGWGRGGTRQGEPSIATDPNQVLHMAYLDENGSHILYKTFDGTTWSDSVRLDNTADTVTVMRPNISIDPNFGVYVLWQEVTGKDSATGLNVYNIKYRTSPNGGTTWNDVQSLTNLTETNSSGYSTKNPTIGRKVREAIPDVGFEGGAEVVWTEANPNSSLGYYIMYSRIPYVGTLTGVGDENAVPSKFSLAQNYPNPFNPTTVIEYAIPKASNVTLSIYNALGQKVASLLSNKMESAGSYKVKFNAAHLPSGIYFYRLQSGNFIQTRKMILMK